MSRGFNIFCGILAAAFLRPFPPVFPFSSFQSFNQFR